jgi:ectoine hydroxylase
VPGAIPRAPANGDVIRLSEEQIDEYHERGFLLIESVFPEEDVERLREAFRRDCEIPGT